jgi:hypothetical protein
MNRTTKATTDMTRIGYIGVDPGMFWIGDSCHILHQDLPKALGKDWENFCALALTGSELTKSFVYDMGHEGLGVVRTGYGDGLYPAYASITPEGRVSSVLIQFI